MRATRAAVAARLAAYPAAPAAVLRRLDSHAAAPAPAAARDELPTPARQDLHRVVLLRRRAKSAA